MKNTEVWKPVHQFTGAYIVSNMGRIMNVRTGHILKPCLHRQGYHLVSLQQNGRKFQATVHSIVAAAFLGPRPTGMVICHFDDDPARNELSNLRYATQKENIADAIRNGRMCGPHNPPNNQGEAHPRAKLSDIKVRTIKQRISNGDTYHNIANDYAVSPTTIADIHRKRTWRHIN
jgi:hypothetical protein